MKITNNQIGAVIVIFILLSLAGNYLVYRRITATGAATSSLIQFCIEDGAHFSLANPISRGILNGTELIIGNKLGWPVNVTFYLRNHEGETIGDIGFDPYDGDSEYKTNFDTTDESFSPEANCEYTIVGEYQATCSRKSGGAGSLSINNEDKEPRWDNFKNNLTTNFSLFESGPLHRKWTNITEVQIGVPDAGLLKYVGLTLNFDDADLDNGIAISQNYVRINVTNLKCLDMPLTITLYNLSFIHPAVTQNDSICMNCSILSYEDGILNFTVLYYVYGNIFRAVENTSSEVKLNVSSDAGFYKTNKVRFYANFTNKYQGKSVNGTGVNCSINITLPELTNISAIMTYNSTSQLYEKNGYFNQGPHDATVYCNAEIISLGLANDTKNFTIVNRNPYLSSPIPNITWEQDHVFTGLDLNAYFSDPDNDVLSYSSTLDSKIDVNITGGILTLTPFPGFYGNRTITIAAADPYNGTADSNPVLLTVLYVPPPPPGGSGGGSGQAPPSEYQPLCPENWICTNWSQCLFTNIVTRKCTDDSNCGTGLFEPVQSRPCKYSPTCSDLVQNQNETGVDCGGPCPACKICNFNGIKDEGELGIDCGGPCSACKQVESPTIILGIEKSSFITILAVLGAILFILMLSSAAFAKIISGWMLSLRIFIIKKKLSGKLSEEKGIEKETIEKLLLLLDHIGKESQKKILDDTSRLMRDYMKELIGTEREITEYELMQVLPNTMLSATTKLILVSFFKELARLEFSGAEIKKDDVKNLINDCTSIIRVCAEEKKILQLELEKASKAAKTVKKINKKEEEQLIQKKEENDILLKDNQEVVESDLTSINCLLDKGSIVEAKKAYAKLCKEYETLPEEAKASTYSRILESYTRLKELLQAQEKKRIMQKRTIITAALIIIAILTATLVSMTGLRASGMAVAGGLAGEIQQSIHANSITILNPQSYPVVGGNWNVFFNTKGKGDLIVNGIDGTLYTYDLEFANLTCGNNSVPVEYTGLQVIARNFTCQDTTLLSNKVNTEGKHNLKFIFGDSFGYANNDAFDCSNYSNWPIISNSANPVGYEGLLYSEFITATDPHGFEITEYKVYKSTNDSFTLIVNNNTGLINFTPVDEDFGNHSIDYKAKNNVSISGCWGSKTIDFYIYDRPSIDGYIPENLSAGVFENTTLPFNITNVTNKNPSDAVTYYWLVDGVLVYNSTDSNYSYNPNFCEAGEKNITVMVNNTYNLSTQMSWNITVENVNRLPVFNLSFENMSWQESTTPADINLSEHFYDLDAIECNGANKDNLTYNYSPNPVLNITISINQTTSNASFHSDHYWAGIRNVTFEVFDGFNITYGNQIMLNITSVNDAPLLTSIPNQIMRRFAPFGMWAYATDPDLPDADILEFFTNDTLFNITTVNSTLASAIINLTPDDGYSTRVHEVNISVKDIMNLTSWQIVNFTVIANTRPYFNQSIGKYTGSISASVNLQINATDLDGDAINYSVSSSNSFPSLVINASTGLIDFTIDALDIGNHTVTVTVTDQWGAENSTSFDFEVLWAPSRPIIQPIPKNRTRINKNMSMVISAIDDDYPIPGDDVAFAMNISIINFGLSKLSNLTANFTAYSNETGNYTILLNATDLYGLNDSIVFVFSFTENMPPVLNENNISANASELYSHQLNATDDDEDTINFTWWKVSGQLNESNFNMSSEGYIFFTPRSSEHGESIISINLSDGVNVTTQNLTINISTVNHPPNITTGNLTAYQGILFNYSVNCSDIDNDFLTYSAVFLENLTPVFPHFSMNSSGFMNFTPNESDVGNWHINITVDDGIENTSKDIYFAVFGNTAPIISNFSPSDNSIAAETESIFFNVTSYDQDISQYDNLTFTWKIDGRNISESIGAMETQGNYSWQNMTYVFGYCDSGNHTIEVNVTDTTNNSVSQTWQFNISDVNRPPYFGKRFFKNQSQLSDSNNYRVNVSENNVTIDHNSSDTYYTSSAINLTYQFSSTNDYIRTVLTGLFWVAETPENTHISGQIRTSSNSLEWGNWTEFVNNQTSLSANKYIQIGVILSTSDTYVSPTLYNITLNYTIGNFSFADNTAPTWINDMSNFFFDPDIEECGALADHLNYTISGNDFFIANFSSGALVITSVPDFGIDRNIVINATDISNASAISNIIAADITHVPPNIQTVPSGGGGSSTTIKEKIVEKEKPILLKIITPDTITMYENDTVIVPLTIKNTGNNTLTGIQLSASTENKNVEITFTTGYIEQLKKGDEIKTNMILKSYQTQGNYEVVVKAKVKDPSYEDTIKVLINSIEIGKKGEEEFNTKIAFTRDLLSQNPQCLELNEVLKDAEKKVADGQYEKALTLLDEVIENCKYLLSLKKSPEEEQAKGIGGSSILIGIIASLILIIAALGYYLVKMTKE